MAWGEAGSAVSGFRILGLGRKSEIGKLEKSRAVGRSESDFETALAEAEGELNRISEASLS